MSDPVPLTIGYHSNSSHNYSPRIRYFPNALCHHQTLLKLRITFFTFYMCKLLFELHAS